jgi:feruloyl esterase
VFARLFVLPQTDHGLGGRSTGVNGPAFQIPNGFDRLGLLTAWVERNEAPGKTIVVKSGKRSMPLCSYPNYPRYKGGAVESADSYESTAP